MKKFQRRDFIKTASIAAVAASAGVMAGCNKTEETKSVAINTNGKW